jgi:hypothetical protein
MYRVDAISRLREQVGGVHKNIDEQRQEWIAEAAKAISDGDWKTKGKEGCSEFLNQYCRR